MMPDDSYEARAESVNRLVRLTPDSNRAARLRARCRMQLERGQVRRARAAEISGATWRVLGALVVGGFCVVYIVTLVTTTLQIQDVLP